MSTEDVINFTKNNIDNSIKENEELYGTNIDFILINSKSDNIISIASDGVEKIIKFMPSTKEPKIEYATIPEWDYNFDEYLFKELENGYEIGYMSENNHYNLWNSIEKLYPNEINYKDGLQCYLQYCADNGITKEYLKFITGLDTSNIMEYFEGLALYEKIEYKGFIIEVDELNFEDPTENIVQIYDNEEDYINNEIREIVSLKTIGLKQNIKDYIDNEYVDRPTIASERNYFTFVLGYDLLNAMLSKSATSENDISYDFCNNMAREFLKSDEYKNEKYSAYEMLEKWVNTNKDYIKEQYNLFIGKEPERDKTRKLDNGMYILDLGYRKEQPIALVEKSTNYGIEYIIAFNYKISDNKIDWSYGYYYEDDILKAKQDFNKVLSNGNLANTFNKNKKDKER